MNPLRYLERFQYNIGLMTNAIAVAFIIDQKGILKIKSVSDGSNQYRDFHGK